MFFHYRTTRLLFLYIISACCCGCAHAVAHRPTDTATFKTISVPILLYHHVQDLPATTSFAKRRWTVTLRKFEDQMDWVAAHGFHPVTMTQLLAHLKNGQPLPPKPIAITFDDGGKDQYEAAFPILKKYNFNATVFVITDSVGNSAYMNWEQLREMASAGMDIEPHSQTHARLSILAPEKVLREISESKKAIESHLNKQVIVFAYPYGSYDDDVIAMVKAAGLEGAVTVSGHNGGYLLRADRSYTLDRYALECDENLAGIARLKGFDQE